MKKLITFALCFLALAVTSCGGGYNPPENPWTDEQPGSEKWLEELTTGEDSVQIKDYQTSDLVGIWQLVAYAYKDNNGNIVTYSDLLGSYAGLLDRNGSEFYVCLGEDMKSSYSVYSLVDGLRVLNTMEGTWSLSGDQIILHEKEYTSFNHNMFTIDLLEKNRVVLKHFGYEAGYQKDLYYYEIYQRVDRLPESEVKSAGEILVANPWKVVADTTLVLGRTFPQEEDKPAEIDTLKIEANTVLANYVLSFGKNGQLSIQDASGVEVASYKYEAQSTGSVRNRQIHLISDNNTFLFQLTEYMAFVPDSKDDTKAKWYPYSREYTPENPDWHYDDYQSTLTFYLQAIQ